MPVASNDAVNIQGALHVDRYLTGFSINYVQDKANFVAQRAASLISVMKQTDLYVVYDRGFFWRDEVAPRPLGGRPEQVGYKFADGSYKCTEFALEHVIDDRQRANADDPIRLDQNATTLLTQKHMIKQDRVWAQNFFVPGAWSTQAIGVASTPGASQFVQFNDALSQPIEIVDYWKDQMHQKTGFMPNTLVLGAAVKRILRSNPDIADRIKYTRTGVADEDLLGSLFEIDNVVVARSIYNAAMEGAADNFQYIVDPNAMILLYIEQNPGLDSPTAIANFAWTGLIPGDTNAIGGVIERGRDDRAHSDYFQGRMAWDLRLVAPDLGVFFSNAVAPGS
jgi:hypothetical protein